jgi:hypothetical protein
VIPIPMLNQRAAHLVALIESVFGPVSVIRHDRFEPESVPEQQDLFAREDRAA